MPIFTGVLLGACALRPPAAERAALLAEHGREREAIALLEERLAAEPRATAERRLLIRLYGSTGRLDQAAAQTERLAEALPRNSPIPWLELGHAFEFAHRYDEALDAYDQAARIAPRDALGPKRGGMRAARWGELHEAQPRLEEALRRDSSDAEAWHALGLVRAGLGNYAEARSAYGAGIAADPRALENRLGLATVALALSEPRAALEQYDLLLQARPDFSDALLGKSWSLILLGQLDAADAVLAEAALVGADPRSLARQREALAARRRQSTEP